MRRPASGKKLIHAVRIECHASAHVLNIEGKLLWPPKPLLDPDQTPADGPGLAFSSILGGLFYDDRKYRVPVHRRWRHHAVRCGFGMGFVDGRAREEAEIGQRAV